MGWTIGHSDPNSGLDNFSPALGKALVLAANFEHKCHQVAKIGKAVHYVSNRKESDPDIVQYLAQLHSQKNDPLFKTIKKLATLGKLDLADVKKLDRSRVARNRIAHELGAVPILNATPKRITRWMSELRLEVRALVPGDNYVSEWIYWIEEKELPPKLITQQYPSRVARWIFGEDEP